MQRSKCTIFIHLVQFTPCAQYLPPNCSGVEVAAEVQENGNAQVKYKYLKKMYRASVNILSDIA